MPYANKVNTLLGVAGPEQRPVLDRLAGKRFSRRVVTLLEPADSEG